MKIIWNSAIPTKVYDMVFAVALYDVAALFAIAGKMANEASINSTLRFAMDLNVSK